MQQWKEQPRERGSEGGEGAFCARGPFSHGTLPHTHTHSLLPPCRPPDPSSSLFVRRLILDRVNECRFSGKKFPRKYRDDVAQSRRWMLAGLKYNHIVQPYSQSQIIIYSHLAGYNTLKVIRSSQSIISSQCGCGCLSVWLDLILLKNSVQPLHCDWSIGSALNRFLAISQPQ